MRNKYLKPNLCLKPLRFLSVAFVLIFGVSEGATAQCVNFIANGSMEEYSTCPNLSSAGTINYATNWKTTNGLSGSSGQLMVSRPGECVSNKPHSSWGATTALTAGSDGTNWLGGHHTEDWQNTLLTPLPAGTYTFYLDAGNVVNAPFANRPTTLQFYGVKATDPDFAKVPAQLMGSVTVDNAISTTNPTWVTRSFQITTTEVYDRIEIVNITPGATGSTSNAAYTYIDNFRLSYQVEAGEDKTVCFGEGVALSATTSGTWSADPSNPGTVTITDPANPTTTITDFSAAGVYTFILTLNGCTDTVQVTVAACCESNAGTITINP